MDELNPKEDEVIDPSNPKEDSEDEDLKFDDEDFDEEPDESEEEPKGSNLSLEAFNSEMKKRGLNYNFKSWDEVAKSEKQRAIDFAKKGMEEPKKEEPKKEELPLNLSERLLKVEQPNSHYVIDDIKRDFPGQDPYDVWNRFEVYRKEADVRAENERNRARIANPSGNTEGKREENTMSKKFMKNFPPGMEAAIKKLQK